MIKKLFLLLAIATALSGATTPNFFPKEAEECIKGYPTHGYIKHREYEGVGYDTGYTTIGAFLTPDWLANFQPFFDVRGHIMNDGKIPLFLLLPKNVSF